MSVAHRIRFIETVTWPSVLGRGMSEEERMQVLAVTDGRRRTWLIMHNWSHGVTNKRILSIQYTNPRIQLVRYRGRVCGIVRECSWDK